MCVCSCVCVCVCVYVCVCVCVCVHLRSAILDKCSRLTQEILLRGLGVLKTIMKLTGRPDLQDNTEGNTHTHSGSGANTHTQDQVQTHNTCTENTSQQRR